MLLRTTFAIISLPVLLLVSCGTDPVEDNSDAVNDLVSTDSLLMIEDSLDEIIQSDYDMSDVDAKERKEFKENLIKIEKEHGVQWDFCTCAVKQDSVKNSLLEDGISDEELERRLESSKVIDEKCKAFFVQDNSRTPEQRKEHEDRIRDCLRAAGINN